jgi:ribosomal protein L12E/L44/L45/RPP1/RPP2
LPHIERAGRRRAAAATASAEKAKSSSNDDSSHDSSEEEEDTESIGSDVDSDVLSDVDFVRYGEENDDGTLLEDFIKF